MAASMIAPVTAESLSEFADLIRLDAGRRLDAKRRSSLGQFFTPAPVARLIASLVDARISDVKLLDPGAGVGALTANLVAELLSRGDRPAKIEATAFEVDERLLPDLEATLRACTQACDDAGVEFRYFVRNVDFIAASVERQGGGMFSSFEPEYDCVVLNPPYKKIRTDSQERALLREVGIETTNLYTGFVALALRELRTGGELVAITPRSFCNGPYFAPFRREILSHSSLTHLHTFDARDTAFGDDEVLQENVVFRLVRGVTQQPIVAIEWSEGGSIEHGVRRDVPFAQVVHPSDPDSFIHVAVDDWDTRVAEIVEGLPASLGTLGIEVSTGRVVDFRARDFLRATASEDTVPLIYPGHFDRYRVAWPRENFKKANAIVRSPATEELLNPRGTFVLVKRFSSKEEPRRVVAALVTPDDMPTDAVAFENHLNYFHARGRGLPSAIAEGLCAFLNSTLVDTFFRQFNGHTQVNATDLRKLRYPSAPQLQRIGAAVRGRELDQPAIDMAVEEELLSMPAKKGKASARGEALIEDALAILTAVGLPREQQNERSALTLLGLLDLKPGDAWSEARNPTRGVTPIMDFAAEHYGKQYAPNTRETVRRFTLHQFRDAGIVVANPDNPTRPVNSPAYCYQVPAPVLALVRRYRSPKWEPALAAYLVTAPTLAARYAGERKMARIPLRVREGLEVTLSPGGQNELIRHIVQEFCSRFTPGGTILYLGDADEKWAHFDRDGLVQLGVDVDPHGKMPDVVVHYAAKGWLILVEAVTSHGPVNAKRHGELKRLFGKSSAPLVYVTAFLDRTALVRYLGEIAWETEVWVADAPSHMIHFNGERFLGPYE